MRRSEFYSKAIGNLGFVGLASRQLSRRLGSGDMTLRARDSSFPLRARRGTSDISVFDQIFVDREYRCLDGLTNVRTIVDAGANVGYSSAYLMTRFPEARVVAIEPDPKNFEVLSDNMKPYDGRVQLFRGALWSEDTTLDFDEDLLDDGDEWARQVGTARAGAGSVPAISMTTLMDQYGLSHIDILKIDIEGAEESVFSAPDLGWMDRVGAIVIEIHGDACWAAFQKAISGRGYDISQCEELTVCLRK